MLCFLRMAAPRVVLLLSIITMVTCGDLVLSQPVEQDLPSAANLVASIHPGASIRRAGWSAFSGLSLGQTIDFGDLIDPGEQPMMVLCSDLSQQSITQLGPVPCPRERTILVQEEQVVAGWQRAEREDISIPFLIVPRATVVLTNQPVIQWHPVQGANTYRIVVRGEDLSRSERVSAIANPQLIYSPDAPALSPGVPYTVEIIASLDGGKTVSSAEEGVPNTSFTVMTPEEADEIQAVVEAIRAEVGNIVVAHLAVAHLYAQNSLHAEALLTLADVTGDFIESGCASISQADETPVVYQMLGDLYMETGVELYATVAYSCALDLAAQSGDQESQALASAALARLVLDEGLRTEYVASAIQLWHQLGAQVHIDALQAEFEYEGE